MKRYWLVKTEPSSYSWDQFVKDGQTSWTGVRNFAARNHLRAMQKGDDVFFYHSMDGKEIVGIATVTKTAFPDPTATEGDWSCVELEPKKPLKRPVALVEVKADAALKEMALLKQSRLSVQPLTAEEFAHVLKLSDS